MTYYDSLSSGDYITIFSEANLLICFLFFLLPLLSCHMSLKQRQRNTVIEE